MIWTCSIDVHTKVVTVQQAYLFLLRNRDNMICVHVIICVYMYVYIYIYMCVFFLPLRILSAKNASNVPPVGQLEFGHFDNFKVQRLPLEPCTSLGHNGGSASVRFCK